MLRACDVFLNALYMLARSFEGPIAGSLFFGKVRLYEKIIM